MKRVAIHIFGNRLYGSIEEHLLEAGIYSCDYKSENAECCGDCEHEECILCKQIDNGDSNVQQESNTNTDTGLFDYDFGELILLVLVVVLIVSCVLIITQKIVDYKKRLY